MESTIALLTDFFGPGGGYANDKLPAEASDDSSTANLSLDDTEFEELTPNEGINPSSLGNSYSFDLEDEKPASNQGRREDPAENRSSDSAVSIDPPAVSGSSDNRSANVANDDKDSMKSELAYDSTIVSKSMGDVFDESFEHVEEAMDRVYDSLASICQYLSAEHREKTHLQYADAPMDEYTSARKLEKRVSFNLKPSFSDDLSTESENSEWKGKNTKPQSCLKHSSSKELNPKQLHDLHRPEVGQYKKPMESYPSQSSVSHSTYSRVSENKKIFETKTFSNLSYKFDHELMPFDERVDENRALNSANHCVMSVPLIAMEQSSTEKVHESMDVSRKDLEDTCNLSAYFENQEDTITQQKTNVSSPTSTILTMERIEKMKARKRRDRKLKEVP